MRRPWLEPALLCLLALAAVAPALLGRPFYTGDLLLYFYPLRASLAAGLRAGGLPWWDDASGCGIPLCADPQAICFDPAAPLYALLELPMALGAEVGLRLALLGLGVWLLLREREVPSPLALVAAVPAMLGGIPISLVGRLDKLGALSCLPWMLLGVERILGARRGGLALLAGAVALGASSGGLEVWAMGVGGALLWAAVWARARGLGPAAVGRAALGVALGLGLSAALWTSFAHLIGTSTREGGIPFAVATEMSARPAQLLGFALPELFNDPGAMQSRLHPGAEAELWYMEALAPGWLCLLLAVRACLGPAGAGRRAARALGLLGLGCVVLGLGRNTPLYGWLFEHVPGFSLWRYPEKFLIPLGIALPVMAGLGLARPLELRRGLVWGAIGLASAGVVASSMAEGLGSALQGLAGAGSLEGWVGWARRVGLGLGLHGLFFAGALAALSRGAWGARLAALLVALDLGLVHLDVNPPGSPALVAPSSASRVLEPGTRVEALSAGRGARVFLLGRESLETTLAGFRASLYPDMGKLDGLRHADSVRAIRPSGPVRLFGAVEDGPLPPYLSTLELAGVQVLVSTRAEEDRALASWPGARPLATAKATGVTLWALGGSAPQLYRAEDGVAFPSLEAMLSALASGAQDPRTLALVGSAEAQGPRAAGDGRWEDGQTQVLERAPGRVRAQVAGERPGWLVFLETWDEGWRAQVDGVEAPVLRAQGAFLAVPVPAGEVEVTLDYRPPGLDLGLGISGGTALLLALGAVVRAQRPRRRSASATMD